MVDTEEVADHFACYTTICQYWEDLAEDSIRSIGSTLFKMLRSNSELNELTSISLVGLNKSINKIGKVSNSCNSYSIKMLIKFSDWIQASALKITRSALFLLGCLKVPEAKRMTLMSFSPQLTINLIKSLCLYINLYEIRWWETYETVCLPVILTKIVGYNASHDIQV